MDFAFTDADRLACGCTERFLSKHGHHGPHCWDEASAKCSAGAHAPDTNLADQAEVAQRAARDLSTGAPPAANKRPPRRRVQRPGVARKGKGAR